MKKLKEKCPYRSTSTNKCTNKHHAPKKSKRKNLCGYSEPKDCEIYLDWKKMRNDSFLEESSIPKGLKPQIEGKENNG